jgi:hypothetical protein
VRDLLTLNEPPPAVTRLAAGQFPILHCVILLLKCLNVSVNLHTGAQDTCGSDSQVEQRCSLQEASVCDTGAAAPCRKGSAAHLFGKGQLLLL